MGIGAAAPSSGGHVRRGDPARPPRARRTPRRVRPGRGRAAGRSGPGVRDRGGGPRPRPRRDARRARSRAHRVGRTAAPRRHPRSRSGRRRRGAVHAARGPGLLCDADRAERIERRRAGPGSSSAGTDRCRWGRRPGWPPPGWARCTCRRPGRSDGPTSPSPGSGRTTWAGTGRTSRRRCCAGTAPGVRTGPPGRNPPDLVVLTDAQARHPDEGAALVGRAVEHLALTVRDGRGVVGPLVLPGRSTCLGCVDLRPHGLDPGWPALVAGLLGRTGTADPAVLAATTALGDRPGPAGAGRSGGRRRRPPPTLGATSSWIRRGRRDHPSLGPRTPAARAGRRRSDAPCGPAVGRGTIRG